MRWPSRWAGGHKVHGHQLLVLRLRGGGRLWRRMVVVVLVVGLPLPRQGSRKGSQKGRGGRGPRFSSTIAQASHGGRVVAPHRIGSAPDRAASNQRTRLGTCRCQT